ncbi:YidC/Oxa1 family membrane protein insertase [Paenibacillus psychroresistens]|uniref:YidC/Oxa1 family membrane protein insertase n=1 Tax=Paenibacillus psychroresistens TaxID=1778678 RepID=A0A6B8RRC2_9BACL|nr:YidC/Oxa1 family membrane protein insertase [Paenibacillus psychroresistens]QGQ98519.1 YidC/Oxa1 family membrane protein insertase [Paenibacillus psychroresistens]
MYSWFYPIAAILQPVLTFFFNLTQDWGLAIIIFTLFIKSTLFFLNLRVARQQVKQAKLQPQLQELRKQSKDDPKKLAEANLQLYKENGIKPFSTIAVALLQMPIFMGMYGLFVLHGGAMTSMLVPWVATLAHADSSHIMPFLAAALTFASSMIPLTSEMSLQTSTRQKLGISVFASTIYIFMMWRSPIALGLYWATSSLYGLLERWFYRTNVGKNLLLR